MVTDCGMVPTESNETSFLVVVEFSAIASLLFCAYCKLTWQVDISSLCLFPEMANNEKGEISNVGSMIGFIGKRDGKSKEH